MAPTDPSPPAVPPDDRDLQERLARLPKTTRPPAGAEDRLVEALRREALLTEPDARARRSRDPRRWLIAALVPLAFAAGLWTANLGRAGGLPEPSHLLLLHTSAWETAPERTPQELQEVFEEHAAWARQLAQDDHLIDAEPIAPGGWRIEAPGGESAAVPDPDALGVSGYFLIRAADDREALALARTCPHLRHGTVEVRRVGG